MMSDKKNLGLYIHVPFCAVKCPYCDFYSVSYSRKNENLYTDAVIRNLERYSGLCGGRKIDTIYFGGGTPSLLSAQSVRKILFSTFKLFNVENSAEITMEANPDTLTAAKLHEFYSFGINRLSIGVQSLDDSELLKLGRKHSSTKAQKAVNMAYDAGFSNISCDIMLGICGQTPETLNSTLEKLVKLPIKHISAYMLKIEPDTPFAENENIIKNLPDDDQFADIYLDTVEFLENHGFKQYEISNFSENGFESRHNLKYWLCEEYIGIAPSAHSFFNGKRYYVPSELIKFTDEQFQTEIINEENPADFEEKAMLRLRLKNGLPLDMCGEKKDSIIKKAGYLKKEGLADLNSNAVFLTPEGFLVSNQIIEYLIMD